MRTHLKFVLVGMSLLLGACGPRVDGSGDPGDELSWMLGTWSSRAPNDAAYGVHHWTVNPDGVLLSSRASECQADSVIQAEYRWQHVGTNAIEVTDVDGGPMDGQPFSVLFELFCGPDYEHLDIVSYSNGEEAQRVERAYLRGKVCLEPQSRPEGDDVVEWDSCRAVWCGGDLPPLAECSK